MHSPQAGVTLFPDWFASAPADWPPQVSQAGFPLYDGDSNAGLDARLSQFLDEGEPPLVFAPGSAMEHGQAFFQAAVQSCEALGRRGILLTRDARQLPQELPPPVFTTVPTRRSACCYLAPARWCITEELAVVRRRCGLPCPN